MRTKQSANCLRDQNMNNHYLQNVPSRHCVVTPVVNSQHSNRLKLSTDFRRGQGGRVEGWGADTPQYLCSSLCPCKSINTMDRVKSFHQLLIFHSSPRQTVGRMSAFKVTIKCSDSLWRAACVPARSRGRKQLNNKCCAIIYFKY